MRNSKHFIASLTAVSAVLIFGTTATALANTSASTSKTVLGKSIAHATGWGTAAPTEIENGVGPGLRITQIHWQNWGTGTAIGWGKTALPKVTGGYYPGQSRIELRATDVSYDSADHARAYMRLQAREPMHPGGSLSSWFEWVGQSEMCN
jgi:hypothetical protein